MPVIPTESAETDLQSGEKLLISVTPQLVQPRVDDDDSYPKAVVYAVSLETKASSWLESFVTEAEVRAFFRGVQAGAQMTGGPYVRMPGIPPKEIL